MTPGSPEVSAEAGNSAARPALIRSLNWKTVADLLRRRGPLSRADLVRMTGMSKPTVGIAVETLESSGLVRPAGYRTGTAGPSPLLYEIDPAAGCILAIDVGREFVRVAVATLTGATVARSSFNVGRDPSEASVPRVIERANSVLESVEVRPHQVRQTVIGTPGVYDAVNGRLLLTGELESWSDPSSVIDLRKRFGATLMVENDVDAAAYAELVNGDGASVPTFAFASVGTGIGVGIVLEGRLHRGAHGAAGEIAYLPIEEGPGADRADALRRGSLESSASAASIVRAARAAGVRGASSAAEVFEAAAAGDVAAREVISAIAGTVAKALASVVVVVDPHRIVLGGGVGRAIGFGALVEEHLRRLVPLVPEVTVSALGSDAVLDGTIALALESVWARIFAGEAQPHLDVTVADPAQ